ncbi:hypothetical protein Hanom_Chr15g01400951 [Helianthus anomalus]
MHHICPSVFNIEAYSSYLNKIIRNHKTLVPLVLKCVMRSIAFDPKSRCAMRDACTSRMRGQKSFNNLVNFKH